MCVKQFFLMLLVAAGFVCYPSILYSETLWPTNFSNSAFVRLTSFEDQGFPKEFSKDRLQRLLQRVVDTVYMKGFRYLGEQADFNHGHILFVSGNPVAILYHTQENAYYDHRNKPGSKYDYLNKSTRNWIQWLGNPDLVENANKYERTAYPDTLVWERFIRYSVPVFRDHYTITPPMLNPEFLGGEVTFELQWRFTKTTPNATRPSDSNVVNVILPTGEIVFLILVNDISHDPSP